MEIWKDIKNYENTYEVSSYGRVRRKYSNRILKLEEKRNGYIQACLSQNNHVKYVLVHRLVAIAFIPNDDILLKTQVNHKNGNKHDNRIENLEWISPSGNRLHAFATGLQTACNKKKIRCKQLNIIFDSSYSAADFLNNKYFKNAKQVKNVAAKIRSATLGMQKTAYGFTWEQVL